MEKLSLVDYPNQLACTLFTAGCNLRCPFCQNKDLVDMTNIIPMDDGDIFSYLEKRKNILDAVVITGGEPTLLAGLGLILKRIKAMGYLVKLDTNGTNPEVLKDLTENKLIDYVAMDIKNSFSKYFLTAGIKENENIMKNIKDSIRYLKEGHIDYEFRTTLVSEFHTEEDIVSIGKMLDKGKALFLQKFVDGGTCIKENLHPVTLRDAESYQKILNRYIKTYLRGY